MKHLVEAEGLEEEFFIDSAGIGSWHVGQLPDPRMRKHGLWHGYHFDSRARQIRRKDFDRFDYIIVMDRNNVRNLHRLLGGDPDQKISLLMDYTHRPGQVADPWYTGDFEATWIDVLEGCEGLLEHIMKGMSK